MNEIFNPTLVISLGPSGKKALDFLQGMLKDMPKDFTNLVDLYDADISENLAVEIQEKIDKRLLSSKGLNKLVDLGYKVRSEEGTKIKVNIYVYWDMHNSKKSIKDLIEILYEINYGTIDKTRHSGVSLFIFPIIEKEWIYNRDLVKENISKLENVISLISENENILKVDSKVYLFHTLSNDGTRAKLKDLEFVSALVTYLNIIPSSNPPLSVVNTRLIKYEKNFKVGTIGISSLIVFKDKIVQDFKGYLLKDLVNYNLTYTRLKSLNDTGVYRLLEYKYWDEKLHKGVPIIKEDGIRLLEREDLNLDIIKSDELIDNVYDYPKKMIDWEKNLKENYTNTVKEKVDKSETELYKELKEEIDGEINKLILNKSLKEAENFIDLILEDLEGNKLKYICEEVKETKYLNDELRKKAFNHPKIQGLTIIFILFSLFLIYYLPNILSGVFGISELAKQILLIVILFIIFIIGTIEFKYSAREIKKVLRKYKDEVYINEGRKVEKYIGNKYVEIRKTTASYLKEKKEEINDYKNFWINLEVGVSKDSEYIFDNMVTELFNKDDRREFYMQNKEDISLIYAELYKDVEIYKDLNGEKIKEKLNNYTNKKAEEYANLDFYNFARFKWRGDLEKEFIKWGEKSVIKAKELLQYNASENIEEHKLFISSSKFISNTKNVLRERLPKYGVIRVEGDNIFTNCISIFKISLGINLDSITPFITYRGEGEE